MGMLDIYNRGLDNINRVSNRFTALLSTDRQKIFRMISSLIFSVFIMALFGCFDFMNWQFDFSRMITAEYWTTVASKTGVAICSFNIGINLNWAYAIERAIELKENIELYEVLIKQKDDDNFDYYVNHIFNKQIKRRAYINKINKKIHWLNRFSKDNDIELYSKRIPLGVENYDKLVKELDEKKSNNKYCIRRKQLEYLKSDEYIKENLDSIGVRYTRVKASAFDLEIDSRSKEEDFRVSGNVGLGRARSSSNVALSVLGIAMLTTSLAVSINQQQFVDQMNAFWFYLCSCIIDAALVIWNVFRGTRSAPIIISSELTLPYRNRNEVLKKYIAWKEENNKEPSKLFKKVHSLINSENNVIEMSKEDFAKMSLQNTENK